jgi:hypothetical protein
VRVRRQRGDVGFRLRGFVGYALGCFAGFGPVGEAAAIFADLRVTKLMQRGDRLPGASSREFAAIYGDVGIQVGEHLAGLSGNLLERNVDCARDVRFDEGGLGQYVDNCERRIAEARAQLFAGDFVRVGCVG